MAELSPEHAADLSAAAMGRAFVAGEADPVAVTEVFLEWIAATDEPVFLTVTAERARAEAKAAAARIRAGRPASPLDGVPIAWKDLFDIAGTTTTAASALLRDTPAAEADAPVVAQAAAAGLVCLGKTNLTEFAYSGLGLNPHFGTPANPHDTAVRRAPGGSSSGSGVAVGAGLAPIAIGTDTGGSVRVPAAFNGAVGYKASEGRIDGRAVFPLSWTLDTVGPLCRTVEDCMLTEAAMRGAPATVRRADVRDLRILVSTTFFCDDIDDTVAADFEAALKRLADAGVTIDHEPVPELAESARLMAAHGTLAAVEGYQFHQARVDSDDAQKIDRRVLSRLQGGKAMKGLDVLIIQQTRKSLAESLAERLAGRLLVGPTVAHVAPEIAPLDADDALFHRVNLKTLRNTMVGNYLNTPGVTIPMAGDGLPTGLLISGNAGEDEAVLSAGLALETIIRGA